MSDNERHFDNHPERAMAPKFAEDLGKLFAPNRPIPVCVDRAVAEAARRHLPQPEPRIWKVRWTVPATAAAAILVGISLWWFNAGSTTQSAREARPQAVAVAAPQSQADIDRNGTVDILDAFTLARHIEAKQPLDKVWDFNGDGLIDRRDVDTVALAAVRLNKGV